MINNDFLNRAIGGIDDDLIADAKFTTVKRRSAVLMRIVPIAAAIAILAACVVGAFSMANRNKPEVPDANDPAVVPPVVDTEPSQPDDTNTIVDGVFKIISDINFDKPLPPNYGLVEINAWSYYDKSSTIYIDIGCVFGHEAADLYADLSIPMGVDLPSLFITNYTKSAENITGELPLINGNQEYYIRQFPRSEETPYLSWVPVYDESGTIIEKYKINHYEKIALDFSLLPTESTGFISITFGWWNAKENKIFYGKEAGLFYYVGESGVGFSMNSREDAKENYEKVKKHQSTKNEAEKLRPKIM